MHAPRATAWSCRLLEKQRYFFITKSHGEGAQCSVRGQGGRSDHQPVSLEREARRGSARQGRPAKPPRRLQPPRRWQDITLWRGMLGMHMRRAETYEGLQAGLADAGREVHALRRLGLQASGPAEPGRKCASRGSGAPRSSSMGQVVSDGQNAPAAGLAGSVEERAGETE